MTHNLFQVDAFTESPFKGNPAAVCLLEASKPEGWMQALAAEMNLSETAFLLPKDGDWQLRWFTPKTEVSLCGHATLASAKVLFDIHPELRDKPLTFRTLSGPLQARWLEGDIELDFPVKEPEPVEVLPEVKMALGIDLIEGVRSGDYFLFLARDDETVRRAEPDFQALAESPIPEVIITAPSADPAFDFISRFFAPRLGINEDPVTGSAHCLLAPYWGVKMGKKDFTAFQASKRGGKLGVSLHGERVRIRGAAVVIFKADLLV
jgi:PhzF family phenazine biosynthesis protein